MRAYRKIKEKSISFKELFTDNSNILKSSTFKFFSLAFLGYQILPVLHSVPNICLILSITNTTTQIQALYQLISASV